MRHAIRTRGAFLAKEVDFDLAPQLYPCLAAVGKREMVGGEGGREGDSHGKRATGVERPW